MPIIISNGWLWINDGTDWLKLFCQEIKVDFKMEPTFQHVEGSFNMGFDMGKRFLVFKARNVMLETHADFSSCIDYLKDWQAAGTFNLEVVRDTSDNKIEWDGDNTSFVVLLKSGFRDMQKIAPEDGTVFKIGLIIFEESG